MWADKLALRALATPYRLVVVAVRPRALLCQGARDAGRRLASAQVAMFGQVGASLATSYMPFGGIAITNDPVVLLEVSHDDDAAGGDHWAPALWEPARPPVALRRQANDAAADGRPARDGGGALRALASAPAGELARLGSQPAPPLARAPSGGGRDALRQQSAPAAGARPGSGAGGGAEAARLAAVHRSRRKAPAPQRCASALWAHFCYCVPRRQSAYQSLIEVAARQRTSLMRAA